MGMVIIALNLATVALMFWVHKISSSIIKENGILRSELFRQSKINVINFYNLLKFVREYNLHNDRKIEIYTKDSLIYLAIEGETKNIPEGAKRIDNKNINE